MNDRATRRRLLRATGAALGGTLLAGTPGTGGDTTAAIGSSLAAARQAGGRWPQYSRDAANTGHAPDIAGPSERVTERWALHTEGGSVESAPAVVDGTAYVGADDGYVYALDVADGSERWRFETDDSVRNSPAVADGTVYVGSYDGNVYALDAADGSERWRFSDGDLLVKSSPTVVDGTVHVGIFTGLYALDAADGSERWRFEADERMNTTPAVVDGTVYAGGEHGTVFAVDAADGSEVWRHESGDVSWTAPAVRDGTVYAGHEGASVVALDAADGRRRWRFDTEFAVRAAPAVDDDVVYAGTFGGDVSAGRVYALDAADGSERWRFETGWILAPPAVAEGVVYVGGTAGLQALDAADGSELWTNGGIQRPEAPLAVTDGAVFVGSVDGTMRSLAGASTDGGGSGGGGTQVSSGEVEAWLDGAEGYDGTIVDRRGQDEVTVRVGDPDSDGLAFDPPAVRVDPGATVVWEWTGRGGGHSVVGENVGFESQLTDEEGFVFERTFAEAGAVLYYCAPHQALGMTGAVLVGGAAATSTPTRSSSLPPQGSGQVPVGIGVTALGVAGGAAWLWRRRGGDDRSGRSTSTSHEPGTTSEAAGRASDPPDDGASVSASDATGAASGSGAGEHPDGTVRPDDQQPPSGTVTDDRTGGVDGEAADAGTGGVDGEVADAGAVERRVPETIPRAPDVAVDHAALVDEVRIGGGGNADVVRATLPTPEGDVTLAIKRPRMGGTLHTDAVDRLLTEAETWAKLDDHDHVVGVVDYGAEPLPWIAMEYMDAGHLGERAGELELPQALWTALSVTRGVRHAHKRGVAHLDLKPANVLFRSVEDAWDAPKVADWGLSKHLLEHSKSVEGLSPQYAAPEQFDESFGATDDLTDVYQLGAVFYELFTGRSPFEGPPTKVMRAVIEDEPTPPSELADLPTALDDVLLTALATEKADRYEDIVYLRDDLLECYEGL